MPCIAAHSVQASWLRLEIRSLKLRKTMSLRCISCLMDNPDTNRFCGNCGAALAHGVPEPAPATETLRTEIQWGALKHATILFADIVSSTEHVAGLDPEEAMEQLRPAVQRMCNAV
jgi:hypothetical protein